MSESLWERLESNRGFPLSVMVGLTESCPLRCGHCYVPDRVGGTELALPELVRLFDELAALGVFRLSFTGGEPALRPDLDAIVAAAWERRFLVSLKTSAAILGRGDVERLRALGLAALHVSLYHIDPEAHDRFVGRPGAWRRAADALETFRALGGMCVVNTVVMESNAGVVGDLLRFCGERGWSFNADPKILRANDGRDRGALRPTVESLAAAMRHLPDARRRSPVREPDHSVCAAGEGSLYVDADGAVWLCPVLPISLGSVRERPIAEIWEGSEFRKRFLAHRWADSAQCMACGRNRFCERCPADAFKEHGDWTAPASTDCRVAEAYTALWEAGSGEG